MTDVGFIFLIASPWCWIVSPDAVGKIATAIVATTGAVIILTSI
jgi:hypothetical protein